MTSLASMTSTRLVRNKQRYSFVAMFLHILLTYPVFTDKQPARAAYQAAKLPKVGKMDVCFYLNYCQ